MGVATFATALYNLAPNNFFVLHFLNLLFQSSMIVIINLHGKKERTCQLITIFIIIFHTSAKYWRGKKRHIIDPGNIIGPCLLGPIASITV